MVRPLMNLSRTFLAGAAIMFCVNMRAATPYVKTTDYNHEAALVGSLTSGDTWQLEASYHWFPIKYVGIGTSVGLWRQIGYNYTGSSENWHIKDDNKSIMNGFIMPSLVLRSPVIVKTSEVDFGFMAEPGLMLNLPYDRVVVENSDEYGIPMNRAEVSNHNGRWWAFNLRLGIYAHIDEIGISLGYVYSNLDIYGMRRNMQYRGTRFDTFCPKRKDIGGAFIKVSYNF